ncbi:MAG: phospholipase [Ruminococcaceae bacterium]|nr:phospholipase [Oscillospiraceae bacterium]MBR3595589.1 dienelactone hydrolase family protein [Clostridia bacterium]
MIRKEYTENEIFSYVEYSPEQMKEGLPIVFQLHGAGERGNGKDELALVDVHGFSKFLENNDRECIFIMPQCPSDTFWTARVESILRFIEEKIEFYKADKKRVYLTGISMGGYGTWLTAMAKKELFAAIAPVCGGGMPWNASMITMPVWMVHGDADTVVNVFYSDEIAEKLEAAGRDYIYTRLPGVGHNAWDYTYKAELIDWLLSKS